jgi:micrococcal nuclease
MGSCLSSTSAQHYPLQHKSPPATTGGTTTGVKPTKTTSSSLSYNSKKKISPTYNSLPEGAQKFRVRNVYDGDTLTLVDERRVRLLGIDTPEMKPPQPYSEEAKQYTKSRCNKQEIWLLIDGEDHYGRLLAHIFVKNNYNNNNSDEYLCINEGLVYEGFALYYTPRKDVKTFNCKKLIDLQSEARRSKRGVWKSFKDILVVKTTNGSAYHKRSCSHLSNSRNVQELKISAATDSGLHPCRTCMT